MIAGAGFAGLWAARSLAGSEAEVLIVDRNNYHTFLPLLYQVSAAEIEPEAIARPVRSIVQDYANVHFVMAEITGIDPERKVLHCAERDILYDYLVLAAGSRTSFFGVEGAEEFSYELKTLEQGIALRNRIITQFERAVVEPDSERRKEFLSFTIVGGGPTGVEFAGALSELVAGIVPQEYSVLDKSEVQINLLEAADHILGGMPGTLQRYAERRLEAMGVCVRTGAQVSRITPGRVECADGLVLETDTVIWTAGVSPWKAEHGDSLPRLKSGRIPVNDYLQIEGRTDIFVAGDMSAFPEDGEMLPMMAPVATSQGERAAENILCLIRGKAMKRYGYLDKGNMVTIGRNKAVSHIFGLKFTGWLAWMIWLAVHLFNLIGFRNRVMVLLGWSWDYLFFERTVKLILPVPEKKHSGDTAKRWVHCAQPSAQGNWPYRVREIRDDHSA